MGLRKTPLLHVSRKRGYLYTECLKCAARVKALGGAKLELL